MISNRVEIKKNFMDVTIEMLQALDRFYQKPILEVIEDFLNIHDDNNLWFFRILYMTKNEEKIFLAYTETLFSSVNYNIETYKQLSFRQFCVLSLYLSLREKDALLEKVAKHFFYEDEIIDKHSFATVAHDPLYLIMLYRLKEKSLPNIYEILNQLDDTGVSGKALLYLRAMGEIVKENVDVGVASLQKVAEMGFADAYLTLGLLYQSGSFFPVNYELTCHYYLQATRLGHTVALFQLARILEKELHCVNAAKIIYEHLITDRYRRSKEKALFNQAYRALIPLLLDVLNDPGAAAVYSYRFDKWGDTDWSDHLTNPTVCFYAYLTKPSSSPEHIQALERKHARTFLQLANNDYIDTLYLFLAFSHDFRGEIGFKLQLIALGLKQATLLPKEIREIILSYVVGGNIFKFINSGGIAKQTQHERLACLTLQKYKQTLFAKTVCSDVRQQNLQLIMQAEQGVKSNAEVVRGIRVTCSGLPK